MSGGSKWKTISFTATLTCDRTRERASTTREFQGLSVSLNCWGGGGGVHILTDIIITLVRGLASLPEPIWGRVPEPSNLISVFPLMLSVTGKASKNEFNPKETKLWHRGHHPEWGETGPWPEGQEGKGRLGGGWKLGSINEAHLFCLFKRGKGGAAGVWINVSSPQINSPGSRVVPVFLPRQPVLTMESGMEGMLQAGKCSKGGRGFFLDSGSFWSFSAWSETMLNWVPSTEQ